MPRWRSQRCSPAARRPGPLQSKIDRRRRSLDRARLPPAHRGLLRPRRRGPLPLHPLLRRPPAGPVRRVLLHPRPASLAPPRARRLRRPRRSRSRRSSQFAPPGRSILQGILSRRWFVRTRVAPLSAQTHRQPPPPGRRSQGGRLLRRLLRRPPRGRSRHRRQQPPLRARSPQLRHLRRQPSPSGSPGRHRVACLKGFPSRATWALQ